MTGAHSTQGCCGLKLLDCRSSLADKSSVFKPLHHRSPYIVTKKERWQTQCPFESCKLQLGQSWLSLSPRAVRPVRGHPFTVSLWGSSVRSTCGQSQVLLFIQEEFQDANLFIDSSFCCSHRFCEQRSCLQSTIATPEVQLCMDLILSRLRWNWSFTIIIKCMSK